MNAVMILQLLTQFGPPAIEMIRHLATIWGKPELTPAEVLAFCDLATKSYDDYIAEAKAKALKTAP